MIFMKSVTPGFMRQSWLCMKTASAIEPLTLANQLKGGGYLDMVGAGYIAG